MNGVNFTDNSIFEKHPTAEEITSNFVDNLTFGSFPLLFMKDTGYTSMQGMCIIENQYVCLVRYTTQVSGGRAFQIYDILNHEFKNETIFTEAQVGHCNSLCYSDGYIYVTTINSTTDVVRLKLNLSTFTLTYQDIISSNQSIVSVGCENGVFYIFKSFIDSGQCRYFYTEDWQNINSLFIVNIEGVNNGNIQGMTCKDGLIYSCFSGRSITADAEGEAGWTQRLNEWIYVINLKGEIVKQFYYSRSSYGELEDVDIVEINGSEYILVSTNVGRLSSTKVILSPLKKNTNQIMGLDVINIIGTNDYSPPLVVNVDYDNGSPFGTGSKKAPVKNIEHAQYIINHSTAPSAKIFLSGTVINESLSFYSIMQNLHIYINSDITLNGDLFFYYCNHVVIDSDSKYLNIKHLEITYSTVTIRSGLDINFPVGHSRLYALNIYRSILSGTIRTITGNTSAYWLGGYDAIVNVSCSNFDLKQIGPPSNSLVCFSGKIVNTLLTS